MEYIKKCNVCGKIFCYTDEDVKANKAHALSTSLSAIASVANAIGGTMYNAYEQGKISNRESAKVIDYNKCPHCGSRDLRLLTDEELKDYQDGLIGDSRQGAGTITINTNASVEALVERGMIFLEDQEWRTAQAYFDNALDAEPKNVSAYIGKLLIDLRLKKPEELLQYGDDISSNSNFKKALKYASDDEKNNLETISKEIIYKKAITLESGKPEEAIEQYSRITDYKDVTQRIENCRERIKNKKYEEALKLISLDSEDEIGKGVRSLKELGNYKDAALAINKAEQHILALKEEKEKERILQAQKKKIEAAKRKKIFIVSGIGLALFIAVCIGIHKRSETKKAYNEAVQLLENGYYDEAEKEFRLLEEYENSPEMVKECIYQRGLDILNRDYPVDEGFFSLSGERGILTAQKVMGRGTFEKAIAELNKVTGYKDTDVVIEHISNVKETISAFQKSFREAEQPISKLTGDDRLTKSLKEVYERFSPYCDEFFWMNDKKKNFESDYFLSDDGLKWIYKPLGDTDSIDKVIVNRQKENSDNGILANWEGYTKIKDKSHTAQLVFKDGAIVYECTYDYKDIENPLFSSCAYACTENPDSQKAGEASYALREENLLLKQVNQMLKNGDVETINNKLKDFSDSPGKEKALNILKPWIPWCGTWKYAAGDNKILSKNPSKERTEFPELLTNIKFEDGESKLYIFLPEGTYEHMRLYQEANYYWRNYTAGWFFVRIDEAGKLNIQLIDDRDPKKGKVLATAVYEKVE